MGRAAVGHPLPPDWPTVAAILGSPQGVAHALRAMGLRPDAQHPWERLALSWDEGPIPDLNQIEAPIRLGLMVLEVLKRVLPDEAAQTRCTNAASQLQEDGAICRALLPSLRSSRRKRAPAQIVKFKEVETAFLRWLHDIHYADAADMIVLQCSMLQGDTTHALVRCMDPSPARTLCTLLSKDVAQGAEALADTLSDHWILWAPEVGSHMGRTVSAFKRVQQCSPSARRTLLAQRPQLPGQPSSGALADYWDTPLLAGDMGKRVVSITLLEPPVRVVVEGLQGPRVQDQNLALITYGAERGALPLPTPTRCNWVDPANIMDTTEALVLDFPAQATTQVLQLLARQSTPLISAWSRCHPSPADRAGRRTVYGYMALGAAGLALQGHLLVRQFRQLLASVTGVAIGHTTLLDDPGALVIDYTETEAVEAVFDLCSQILLLDNHRGVLLTEAAEPTWRHTLTTQAKSGGHRIKRVAWRQSTRGGRAWVMPDTLTGPQRASLTGDWTEERGLSKTAIHIQIRGDTAADPLPWQKWLGEHSLCVLPSAARWTIGRLGEDPKINSITPIAGIADQWDGGLIMTTGTAEETELLAAKLNSLCVGGASGTSRLRIHLMHDMEDASTSARAAAAAASPTSGRRSGKGGRAVHRAGRPSA